MTNQEKFDILVSFLEKRYGDQKTFLHYKKDYELLIAIILSAQAKDEVVNKVTPILFNKYKSLNELSCADFEDVYCIIKDVGLGKNKTNFIIETSKILVDKYDSKIPLDRKELTKLPGVGDKVAGVFLGELYNYPFLPIDTHIQRISKRLGFVEEKSKPDEIEKKLLSMVKDKTKAIRIHKHLISFGRDICLSGRKRNCIECPLNMDCPNKMKNYKS